MKRKPDLIWDCEKQDVDFSVALGDIWTKKKKWFSLCKESCDHSKNPSLINRNVDSPVDRRPPPLATLQKTLNPELRAPSPLRVTTTHHQAGLGSSSVSAGTAQPQPLLPQGQDSSLSGAGGGGGESIKERDQLLCRFTSVEPKSAA